MTTASVSLGPKQSTVTEVHDSFYELLIYESIELLISQVQVSEIPSKDRQPLGPDFFKELEDIGKAIGRKIIDVLVREVQVKFQT